MPVTTISSTVSALGVDGAGGGLGQADGRNRQQGGGDGSARTAEPRRVFIVFIVVSSRCFPSWLARRAVEAVPARRSTARSWWDAIPLLRGR